MNKHCEHCGVGPLERDEVLRQAQLIIEMASKEALQGRPTEASVLNSIAQTAIALVERIAPAAPLGNVH